MLPPTQVLCITNRESRYIYISVTTPHSTCICPCDSPYLARRQEKGAHSVYSALYCREAQILGCRLEDQWTVILWHRSMINFELLHGCGQSTQRNLSKRDYTRKTPLHSLSTDSRILDKASVKGKNNRPI